VYLTRSGRAGEKKLCLLREYGTGTVSEVCVCVLAQPSTYGLEGKGAYIHDLEFGSLFVYLFY
jgi:hypothetical protein